MRFKKSARKKRIIITLPIALAIICAGAFYFLAVNNSSDNDMTSSTNTMNNESTTKQETNFDEATEEQKAAGTAAANKNGISNNSNPSSNNGNSMSPTSVPVTITSVGQNNTTITIRTLIETVTNVGTCTLTLKNDTKSITRTSSIQALASSSTCKGFDIDTSELGSGAWFITVDVATETATGTASQTTNIK